MHSFNLDLTLENVPSLINTDWYKRHQQQWLKASEGYNYTQQLSGLNGEKGVERALQADDWQLATRVALMLSGEEDVEQALELAYKLDNPLLVFSILCFYQHRAKEVSDWIEVSGNIACNALEHKAEKVFLLGLLEPAFSIEEQQTSFHFNEDAMAYTDTFVVRPLDKLLDPVFSKVLDKIGLDLDFEVTTSACCIGEDCKVDLFAALVMEGKYKQANALIEQGWGNINPMLEHPDCSLIDFAVSLYDSGQHGLLNFLVSVADKHIQYTTQFFSGYEDNHERLTQLSSLAQNHIDKMNELYGESLSNKTPTEQVSELPFTYDLQYRPLTSDYIANKPKAISVLDDVNRIYPGFFDNKVTDLTISLMDANSMVIELYRYSHCAPSKRGIIDIRAHEVFSRLHMISRHEGSIPTDFQLQLAFLTQSIDSMKNMLSQLEEIDIEDKRRLKVDFTSK